MRLLLDTCALIWLVEDQPISEAASASIAEAHEADEPLAVSPISAWEVGLLVARGRLSLSLDPLRWFERIADLQGVEVIPLAAAPLIASSFLPGEPPRDPADRMIIATARESGLQILTRDRKILDYAGTGHVRALAC